MQKTNQSFKTITEALLFMCKCSRRFSLISHKPLQLCYKMSAVSRFSAVLQIQEFNFIKSKQKFFWLRFLRNIDVSCCFQQVRFSVLRFVFLQLQMILLHIPLASANPSVSRLFTHRKVATDFSSLELSPI